MSDQGYWGQNTRSAQSDTSHFNVQDFHINQALKLMSTATLVQVKAITSKGKVEAPGTMDVQPLVNLLDGQGKPVKHETAYNLIFTRVQAKEKAIIMDPKVGDIGVAVFCDRDISAVKKNKKQSNPGSNRRFDMADGVYIGTVLGAKPTCYLRFTDDDKVEISPDDGKTMVFAYAKKIITMFDATQSDPLMTIATDTHVAIKWLKHPDMHITIDKPSGTIIMGQTPVIGPDPYPDDWSPSEA